MVAFIIILIIVLNIKNTPESQSLSCLSLGFSQPYLVIARPALSTSPVPHYSDRAVEGMALKRSLVLMYKALLLIS